MTEPLDLAAVEARLNDPNKTGDSLADCWALLVYGRALRAALKRLNDAKHGSSTHDDVMETIAAHRNADAVLNQVIDGEVGLRR